MEVQAMNVHGAASAEPASASSLRVLMTRARWIEVTRILLMGVVALLFGEFDTDRMFWCL